MPPSAPCCVPGPDRQQPGPSWWTPQVAHGRRDQLVLGRFHNCGNHRIVPGQIEPWFHWTIARALTAKARLRCEDPACGIKGENPNIRFGRWVRTNFMQTHRNTMLNARRLWEVFGQRQDEVASISPRVGTLAARSIVDWLLADEGRDRAVSEGWGPRVG